MSRRRIETISNTQTGECAKVYRDSEFAEYVVRFYGADGKLNADADYHTDSLSDAQGTARAAIWRKPAALADLIPFEALVPGERFTRIGSPHFVCIKTTHTWAHAMWKGTRHDMPLHWSALVRRAAAEQLNPGEVQA
jgi:hypothetical protein